MLPSQVARDLDRDPERLTLVCLPMLGYADAFRAWKRGNKRELKHWSGSRLMEMVKNNDFDEAELELAHPQDEA